MQIKIKKVFEFLNEIKNLNKIQTIELKYKIQEIESEFYNIEEIEFYPENIKLINNKKKLIENNLLEH